MNPPDLCVLLPQGPFHPQHHHYREQQLQHYYYNTHYHSNKKIHPLQMPPQQPAHLLHIQEQQHQQKQHKMSLQQQQQQQQQAYRSNNRACDRSLIATPTPSTNSDYSSDAGEGHVRRVSLDVDSFSRTKNPDQMAKKRSGSMDTETAINGFRQLSISSTPPIAPIDTTTTNTATATATATTKTTHTADNSGGGSGSGSGGNIHYQDYHCKNYHRYYYPLGWPPLSRTLAIITPAEATTPTSTAPRRGRPRNSGNNNNKNNNGPRPSWPPARHYYHYHHPIHALQSSFVFMDPKPYNHQSAFPPDSQQQDSFILHQRPVAQDHPGPGHHLYQSQHYPSQTPVAQDPSSLPLPIPTSSSSSSSSSFHTPQQHQQPHHHSFWPSHSNQKQPHPAAHFHYQQEARQYRHSYQWHREQDQQGLATQQHHDVQIEKDNRRSNNDSRDSNINNNSDYPPLSSKRLSASSSSSTAIDLDPQSRQQKAFSKGAAPGGHNPSSSSSTSMPLSGPGSSGGGGASLSSRGGTVFDRAGYTDETMQESDRRSYAPHPPFSPHPHQLSHPPHSVHHSPPYPYSPASPASFANDDRDQDREGDIDVASSSSTRGAHEPARPISNLTYQHRQHQLQQQQQQQQQQQHRSSLARHQGRSPPTSPSEEHVGNRSNRFSLSSIDGSTNNHTHPIPPLHHRHNRESSLTLSTTATTSAAAISVSNRNLDLDDSPSRSADRPPSSSSSSSTPHEHPSSSQAAAASNSSTTTTATAATAAAAAATSYSPLDDPSSSSSSRHYARSNWEYDLVPRASFHPLDNPKDFHPYVRSHHQPHPHPHPYPYDYPYHRPYSLNRSGSFDKGHPEHHYPRSHWDAHFGTPHPSHLPPRPHLHRYPPPPPPHHSAYFDAPPPPLSHLHGSAISASSSTSRPSVDNSNHHHAPDDGEGEREGGGGEEPQQRRGGSQSSSKFPNLRFKFGTDMPSTIDLKSAIESCDILCRFALHYENQVKNSNSMSQATVGGSALGLDPIERASLQKIRSMNTTMLIGIQKAEKMNDPSSSSSTAGKGPADESLESDRVMMEEDIELDEMEEWPLRFGPGQPWNVMVLELARAATSIFQLAIRIKAWVNMTPEERELDEEINMIRGKRCLLMDSALAVPTVDQHGNLQKDWAVVPATTSTSKSFYQRQRDLEQQRQTHSAVLPKQTKSNTTNSNNNQAQSTAVKHDLGTSMDGNGMMVDRDGALEGNAFKIPRRNSSSGGVSSTAANRHNSLKNEGVTVATAGTHILAGGAAESGSMIDSEMSSSFTSNATSINSSFNDASGPYRSADGVTRNSKNSDIPHQKYRKRAKRSQAPGRCQSCHSSDTPEWRRGPDGARTLCNACGLHYAKLLRRQNEQAQQSPSRISSALPSSNSGTTATNNSSSTITTSTTSTSMMFSAPSPPVPAPTPISTPSISTPTPSSAVAPVSGGKVTSHPSSRMDSSFPIISFPFKRLHGLVKTDANSSSSSSATSTATATATTATSTANVMATTTTSSERSGLASLSLSFSSDGRGSRTLAEHQVVPRFDSQSGHAAPVGNNARHRVGYGTNTSQYQLLQRQQQQYQEMEFQKPRPNQHQGQPQQSSSYMRDDVDIDESRVKRES